MVRSQYLLAAVWANNTLSVLLVLEIYTEVDLHATALTVFFEWVWTVTVSFVIQFLRPIAAPTLRGRWNTKSVAARVASWTCRWVRLLGWTLHNWWLRTGVGLVFCGGAATIRRKSAVSCVAFNVGDRRIGSDIVCNVLWFICQKTCGDEVYTNSHSQSRHSNNHRRRQGKMHNTAGACRPNVHDATAQTYIVSDWARLHLRILFSEALNDLIGIVGGAIALVFIFDVALVHAFLVAFGTDCFQRWASRSGPVGE